MDIYREIYESKLASGVTFSGGEPFLQEEALLALVKVCKAKGRNIVIYTFQQAFYIAFMRPKDNGEHNKGKRYPAAAVKEIIVKRQCRIKG